MGPKWVRGVQPRAGVCARGGGGGRKRCGSVATRRPSFASSSADDLPCVTVLVVCAHPPPRPLHPDQGHKNCRSPCRLSSPHPPLPGPTPCTGTCPSWAATSRSATPTTCRRSCATSCRRPSWGSRCVHTSVRQRPGTGWPCQYCQARPCCSLPFGGAGSATGRTHACVVRVPR